MSVLQGVDRLVQKAVLEREDGTALGLCRILLVGVFLVAMLTHVGAVGDYFSDASTLAGAHARQAFPSRWSLFFWITDPWAVRSVFALGVVAHLFWLVGYYTRAASMVAWLVWISMVGRHPLLYSLADQLLVDLCTLMMIVPGGRGLSLDVRWRNKATTVPVWCRRLIQLQMAVVYTATGILKDGKTWWDDGTALYYALANPYNRHFNIPQVWAALQPWVLRPATWVVLAWELLFAPFVVVHWVYEILARPRRFPDLRKLFLTFGFVMHVGIQLMMYVAFFSPLAIASYVAFLMPDEVKRMLAWRPRERSPARSQSAASNDATSS